MSQRRGLLSGLLPSLLGGLLHWAPVWVALLLLWQVATRGLVPALAEEVRLEEAAEVVEDRHARAKGEFDLLSREAAAWEDPVYRERRRRALTAEQEQPATTEPEVQDAEVRDAEASELEASELEAPGR